MPNGKSHLGRVTILKKKFESAEISTEELREYACLIAYSERIEVKTTTTITVWGKKMTISLEEYKTYCMPVGL